MPHGFLGKRTQLPSHDLLRQLLLPLEGTKLAFGCALKYGAVNPLLLPALAWRMKSAKRLDDRSGAGAVVSVMVMLIQS